MNYVDPRRPQAEPEPAPATASSLVGTHLSNGRYTLIEELGRGGMGTVYSAQHNALQKQVAIKVLLQEHGGDREQIKRFLVEAQAASKIAHDNVVDVTDFGVTEDGSAFIVMELLKGEPLGDTMHREGPFPWVRAKKIALQVCRALHAAHEKGYMHRDVKPDNCFRSKRGANTDFVKVLDFGIAKVFGEEDDPVSSLTRAGTIFGTPEYMSPEQARGLDVDFRTDVYSVGIMVYAMLTGAPPFTEGTFMTILSAQAMEPLVPPSQKAPDANISPELDAVVVKALAKDPNDRYQSIRRLAEALARVPVDTGPTSPHTPVPPVAEPIGWGIKHWRTLAIVLAVLDLVLTLVLVGVLLR